jgi:hypothetical protein
LERLLQVPRYSHLTRLQVKLDVDLDPSPAATAARSRVSALMPSMNIPRIGAMLVRKV